MNERGYITVQNAAIIIDKAVKEKLITALQGDELIIRIEKFADKNIIADPSKYKTVEWKYGESWRK